jgi:hypothetical protein
LLQDSVQSLSPVGLGDGTSSNRHGEEERRG